MNKFGKIAIVVVLIAAVVVVIAVKQRNKADVGPNPGQNPSGVLPRLLDIGSDQCIPCKMMAPIIEELKKEYAGRLEVEFVDVWKNPDQGERYGIRLIPTQIFFDAAGKELFRHEGFFSKEDILGKWKEFGVTLDKGINNETN